MRLIRVIFRQGNKVVVAQKTQPNQILTPISSVKRKYLLLGKQYSVRITKGERNSLKIADDIFHVTLAEMSRENFETFIENWYRRTARKIFEAAIQRQADNLSLTTLPQIKVYKMKRAWGRCYYQKGVITLNLHLVKAPTQCIDYIVLHELCHFTHHNHGKDFHAMVASIDPHWKVKDVQLKEFARQQVNILQKLHI